MNAILIEWGMPIAGRELKALEVYAATMQYWDECKTKGRITDYRPFGCITGNMTERSGFVILEGSQKQIDELRHSDDFRVQFNRIATIGEHIRVEVLETGNEMMTRMQRYGQAVKDVGVR